MADTAADTATMVALSLSASVIFTMGTLLFEEKKYTSNKRFCIAVFQQCLFLVSIGLNIFSLRFGSISLKAGLGVFDIVLSPCISYVLKRHGSSWYQTVAAVLGCGLCIGAQFPPRENVFPSTIRDQWQSGVAIGFVCVECIVAVVTLLATKRKYFSNIGIGCVAAGLFTSLSTLLFNTYFKMCTACSEEESGLLLGFAIVCLILFCVSFRLGIYQVLNPKGEEIVSYTAFSERQTHCVFMYTLCLLVTGALNGVVVSHEMDHMSIGQGFILCIGILVCVVSLYL